MPDPFTLGFDLGGTRLKSVRLGAHGDVEHVDVRPSHAERGPDAAFAALDEARRRLCPATDDRPPRAVGLVLPGVIEPAGGRLVGTTPHLPGWRDVPVRETLAARFGVPVAVDNDANGAALAEATRGAARGADVALMVCVGTGVGAGIVIGGQVYRGAWGGAGEIGHLPLVPGRRACGCGVVGCMEAEMSGGGIARAARLEGVPHQDAVAAFRAAQEGEPGALRLVERWCDRLATAIGAAVQVLNPDVIVLGGGVVEAGPPLVAGVERALEHYALASHRTRLRVALATLGERAGAIGAGLLAAELPGVAADGVSPDGSGVPARAPVAPRPLHP